MLCPVSLAHTVFAMNWLGCPMGAEFSYLSFGRICHQVTSDYLLNFPWWSPQQAAAYVSSPAHLGDRLICEIKGIFHKGWKLYKSLKNCRFSSMKQNLSWLLSKFESWILKLRKTALDRVVFQDTNFDRALTQEQLFIPKQNCDP